MQTLRVRRWPSRRRWPPALRELASDGVAAFATRLATPPLSEQERADLDAEEAELAAMARAGRES